MSNHPLFTVATITYNSSKWVRATIESVLSSIYTDFEYIISDDCSSDDTWQIIQEYKDPRIIAWSNEKNLGEYPNRQKVLERARGKYIIYIDGDDMIYKDSLQRYSWYLQDYPGVKAIWGAPYNKRGILKFPALLSGEEILQRNYLHNSLICFVGFPESLFEVNALKSIGGLNVPFDIGDTYIKKKFACKYDVLFAPLGMSFWRRHENQASQVKTAGYKGFIQNYLVDQEILSSEDIPLKNADLLEAKKKFKIRTLKLLISKTLIKGKSRDFFLIKKKLSIRFKDFWCLFQRGNSLFR